jgi:hypothetical protein
VLAVLGSRNHIPSAKLLNLLNDIKERFGFSYAASPPKFKERELERISVLPWLPFKKPPDFTFLGMAKN